ncbi:hypothetical protein QDX25_07250 [Auritidibacter ignavus]|uniref:hypothetical protein n=1 Tax=Auritidibacter ignavus TaxID=678932 RepID=UPI002447639A|nr:hypothetical protein [Auritidibacter ignavus]WGH80604.1 hypothetical protein QDX25_07250 [Auritidibacter ignavus]
MAEVLVFPDTREALFDLVDGTKHSGHVVSAVYHLPVDAYGMIESEGPVVQIGVEPGAQGWIDRTDRLLLSCYAPGETAMNVLNSVVALVVGNNIETPKALLDTVRVDQVPHEVPYASDQVNRCEARLLVTVRPVE